MKRIAVIGAGIAGMSAAHLLSRKHEVHLFEKEERLGGHTHTITVDSPEGPLPVDTGFIVHNERNYPNFVRLMRELGVETQESDMSFAVTSQRDGYEYSSRGLSGFFAQRSNVVRLSQYKLLAEIVRFNREARALVTSPDAQQLTLGQMLDRGRFSDEFRERYLYPMACAVWSMSFDEIEGFPAATLVRFFDNHGMLGINTHPQWRVIKGGSNRYIAPMTAAYRDRITTGANIVKVRRNESDVEITFVDRPSQTFDEVVFACHGNQVLPLLDVPTDQEIEVFSALKTSRNDTVLHTDASMLPRRPAARASWNYNIGAGAHQNVSVTYHMNRLQSLPTTTDYCVSLNANGSIDSEKVIRKMVYYHPLFNHAAIDAQARWSEVSGRNRTHFAGAYWFYGFHEDGLNSAIRVAGSLDVEW
jgi:predicted NAD/FAD-binding protein